MSEINNRIQIEKAYVEDLKEELTVQEIKNHQDFNDIRQGLKCTTEGCQAKLCFVIGNNLDYLRTYPKSNHTEECEDYFERIKEKNRTEKIGEIEKRLTEKDYNSRNKSFFKKLYSSEEESGEKKTRTKKNKNTDENTSSEEVNVVSIPKDGSGSEVNESDGLKEVTPRIVNRELHQISENDIHSIFKSNGYIDSVNIKSPILTEINVTYNNKKAIYILSEAFFNSGRISADTINEYVLVLSNYIKGNHVPIQVITSCEIRKVANKNEPQILYINDYAWLNFAVETSKPKFLNFPNLVAMISHSNF